MAPKFRLVGINDDANTCSCCGRDDLKRVLWLVALDADGNPEGDPIPYGTSCGAKALGWAYPKHAATKRKIEGDAYMAMRAKVEETMQGLIKQYLVRGVGKHTCYLIPPICVGPLYRGEITLEQAIAYREEIHPLFAFLSGKLNHQQAFNLILKHRLEAR